MKSKFITKLVCFMIVLTMASPLYSVHAQPVQFSDVKAGEWYSDYIVKLQDLRIMSGMVDGSFGVGKNMTRAEFVTALCNLMKWNDIDAAASSFTDIASSDWYFKKVETACQNGVFTAGGKFRPNDPVTREEMAVMAIKAIGYGGLAEQLTVPTPFSDVTNNSAYISLARNFGIISGVGDNKFAPAQTAKREQVAAIFVRIYDTLNNKISFVHAFYAINSFSQVNAISSLNAASYGWSRLETDGNAVSHNVTSSNGNEYRIPDGYEVPYNAAGGKPRLLMIAVSDSNSKQIVNNAELRNSAIDTISSAAINGISKDSAPITFDGVVVDFEGLKADSKSNFNSLLFDLRKAMPNRLIYVMVHPGLYYDGYDYKTIGEVADKVIVMAHDYNPKSLTSDEMVQGIVMTPGASLRDVYTALSEITDANTGIADKNKIVLQINFSTVQWKLQDGKVINSVPYTPDYSAIVSRMQSGAEINYSKKYETPYIKFKNTDDNTDNIVWYEDARSVNAKIKLAEMFGISGISLWRLGSIPDYGQEYNLDVMSYIQGLRI